MPNPAGPRREFPFPLVGRPHPGAALCVAAVLACWPCGASADAPPLWTFEVQQDIRFIRLTPLGTLVVGTKDSLFSLDPASGEVVWKRGDIHGLSESTFEIPPGADFALVSLVELEGERRAVSLALDLATGRSKWDTRALPRGTLPGSIVVPWRRLSILGIDPGGEAGLSWRVERQPPWAYVAVDLDSARILWRQDTLFQHHPQTFETGGGSAGPLRRTLEGHQRPVMDTDSTTILYVSRDGPMRLDLRTGAKLWTLRTESHTVPTLAAGFAPLLLDAGVLYIPSVTTLGAVRAADGESLWAAPARLPAKVVQMQMTSAGLLVRGSPTYDEKGRAVATLPTADLTAWLERRAANNGQAFLTLLDPGTGRPRWRKPAKMGPTTPFVVRGDTVYVADGKKVMALGLRSGVMYWSCKTELDEQDVDLVLEARARGILLSTRHTLRLTSPRGLFLSAVRYPALRGDGWLAAAGSLPGPASGVPDTAGRDHVYVLTRLMDDSGQKGPALIKVDKDTGRILARVMVGDEPPVFRVDAARGRLFLQQEPRRINCYSF